MNRHRSIVAAPRGLDRSLSDEPRGNAHSASNRLRRPMNKQAQPAADTPFARKHSAPHKDADGGKPTRRPPPPATVNLF
ncbi:hypothetical protein XAR_3026 [Xanthomonas citri pv. glycines str. 8ra]|nr:hypothetical protein XAR_3026 [Xanthomonas citri pv. glycines str. 8ra]